MNIETIEDIPSLASYLNIEEAHNKNRDLSAKKEQLNKLNLFDFEKAQLTEHDSYETITKYDKDFSRIDLHHILKLRIWSKALKMYVPKFAIYNINNNKKLIFSIQDHYKNDKEEIIINSVDDFGTYIKDYSDIRIISTLTKKWNSSAEITQTIYHQFSGILSDSIREKIHNLCNNPALDISLWNIYIIAEAYHWTKDKVMVIPAPKPDPVVIFIKNEIAYYLGSFDLTPPEKFITEMVG